MTQSHLLGYWPLLNCVKVKCIILLHNNKNVLDHSQNLLDDQHKVSPFDECLIISLYMFVLFQNWQKEIVIFCRILKHFKYTTGIRANIFKITYL
jgi:hypothetical protein